MDALIRILSQTLPANQRLSRQDAVEKASEMFADQWILSIDKKVSQFYDNESLYRFKTKVNSFAVWISINLDLAFFLSSFLLFLI